VWTDRHIGQTCLKHIKGEWQNGPKRNLLIGAIAGTLEALTKPDMDARTSNCFSVDGKKGCNVGTPIRVSIHYNSSRTQPMAGYGSQVNLPPSDGKSNFMYVDLRNTYDGSKKWDCCSDGHRSSRRAFPAIPSVWGLRLLARLRWSILGCFGGLILGVKVAWIE
jgi:hypothetical protein